MAERLLATGGPEAVTVRAVADEADTTTRAVYAVFGSKEGLLAALAARGYALLAELVDGLPVTDDPAADLVDAGLVAFRGFALSRPHLFRVTFDQVSEELIRDPAANAALVDSYDALVRRIRALRAAGGIGEATDAEIAFGFHSLCVGLANGELDRRPPPEGPGFWRPVHGVDGERLWRVAVAALVAGLRGPAADARQSGVPRRRLTR